MQCGTTHPSEVVMADSFRLSRIEIDWSNVAHLEAAQANVCFDECVPILKLAPKLKRIIFNIYREPYPPKLLTSSPQVTLPNLCSLDLINAVSHHMYLFDVLTLPSLEELSAPWIRDRASLVGLLRRSSCHLSHFHVGAVFSLASEVISFTRKMPYLKVISLQTLPLTASTNPPNSLHLPPRTVLIVKTCFSLRLVLYLSPETSTVFYPRSLHGTVSTRWTVTPNYGQCAM